MAAAVHDEKNAKNDANNSPEIIRFDDFLESISPGSTSWDESMAEGVRKLWLQTDPIQASTMWNAGGMSNFNNSLFFKELASSIKIDRVKIMFEAMDDYKRWLALFGYEGVNVSELPAEFLDILIKQINPPESGRDVVLGSTEYLFPYITYLLMRTTKDYKIGDFEFKKITRSIDLPFVFLATAQDWTHEKNIHFIDTISSLFGNVAAYNKIRIHLSKDPLHLSVDRVSSVTPMNARVLFFELWRLNKQIEKIRGKKIRVTRSIIKDYQPHILIQIDNSQAGGAKRRRTKRYKYCKHAGLHKCMRKSKRIHK